MPVEDPDHTADDEGAHDEPADGAPADDESADFDLPLDASGMTLAELKKALNDPDDPRHTDAKELNAKLAADLAPALDKFRSFVLGSDAAPALDKFRSFVLGSDPARAIGKNVVEFLPKPTPLVRHADLWPRDETPIKLLPPPMARSEKLAAQQLEVLESMAAQLNEQGQTLQDMRAEGKRSATGTFKVTVVGVVLTFLTLGAAIASVLLTWYGFSR